MMTNRESPSRLTESPTRRQVISCVVALSSLATVSRAWAQQKQAPQTPGKPTNDTRTSLHQEVRLSAKPERIYAILLSSTQFAAFSGLAADIDPRVGGAFSMFAGMIGGRNVELVANERIVQAWRPTHWNPGVYSIARFDLKPQGSETIVVLEHKGFPEGDFDHLSSGWNLHYWEPLTKFVASTPEQLK